MTFGKRRSKTRESFVPDSSAVERAITSLERMLGDSTVSGGSGKYGLLKIIVNEYRLTRSRLESVELQLLARVAELAALDAAQGEAVAWVDEFGNVYPLAAYSGKGDWQDDHKRHWKRAYLAPPAQPVAIPAGKDWQAEAMKHAQSALYWRERCEMLEDPVRKAPPAAVRFADIEAAARYGWEHASWEWEDVRIGLGDRNDPPAAVPASAHGYNDDDRKRIVSAMQSMRDRLGGYLTKTYGDQFDGDIDTMLEAINFMKAVRHYKDHVPLICAKHPATLALPARKSPPAPHTDGEECNCVQVAYADGWNDCRERMLAANKENNND